ncbi:MAG: hypothetical protein OEW67_00375 [Cyclobacteriaceae bacterium]|nr:hypothetical protein [Cyclobacteriaceae bacterium]
MDKKLSLFLAGIATIMSIFYGQAQDLPTLGLLFSQTSPGGSARVQALGGAQISLGGDISSLQSNPAGLGMFNRSTFSLSTGLSFINSNASFYGTNTDGLKLNANIPNFGVVLQKEGNRKIKSHSFGISYNRIADYQNRFVYEGRNSQSSMLDYFIERADGILENEFYNNNTSAYNSVEGLAVRTLLILPTSFFDPTNGADDLYDSDILGNPFQKETVDVRGAQYQFNLGYGFNFDDILYLGANIGITSVNYNSTNTYSENNFAYTPIDANDTYQNPLNGFNLEENLNVSGGGVNTTLGIMFRPVDFVQIGAAFTSPTYFNFDEEFHSNMDADYKFDNNQYTESDIIVASYNLSTPMKLSSGITFFGGKYGFISADVEMIDYGKNRFSSNDFSTTAENSEMKTYHKVYNFRVGGEVRFDIFRLRGGYSLSQTGDDEVTPIQSFTGGAGIRYKYVSFDLGVVNVLRNFNYSPYTLSNKENTPTANVFQNTTKTVMTLGLYF